MKRYFASMKTEFVFTFLCECGRAIHWKRNTTLNHYIECGHCGRVYLVSECDPKHYGGPPCVELLDGKARMPEMATVAWNK